MVSFQGHILAVSCASLELFTVLCLRRQLHLRVKTDSEVNVNFLTHFCFLQACVVLNRGLKAALLSGAVVKDLSDS